MRHVGCSHGRMTRSPGSQDPGDHSAARASVHAAVAVYETHDVADAALRSLEASGFDMRRLSAVGKGLHTKEQAVCALLEAVTDLGIPEDSVVRYESELEFGRFLILARGSEAEIDRARSVLSSTCPSVLDAHPTPRPDLFAPEPI